MADRDSRHPADDARRRTSESSASLNDSRRDAEGRDAKGSPHAHESKYDAAASRRPASKPLKVKIEFVVINGPAAAELIKRQAAAVRDALQWFAENPPDEKSA